MCTRVRVQCNNPPRARLSTRVHTQRNNTRARFFWFFFTRGEIAFVSRARVRYIYIYIIETIFYFTTVVFIYSRSIDRPECDRERFVQFLRVWLFIIYIYTINW